MYSSIVVGTDGSDHALDAVRRAGQLAQRLELPSVHVVCAIAPDPSYTLHAVEGESGIVSETAVTGSAAEEYIAAAEATLASHSVSADPHIVIGDASNAILEVADRVDADLIVVGARGLSALQRFVRGSVSTRIAHHSTRDVLIVEHDD